MKVKIYDPDGDMVEVEQVDARECVEMGYYTMEPPEPKKPKDAQLTVAQIKEQLIEKEIDFEDSMKKAELLALLESE